MGSFKPRKFGVEQILFGLGLINFSIRLLNMWHDDELRVLMSRLMSSTDGGKEFLKKIVFALKKGIWLRALCEAYELLFSDINLGR